MIRSTMVLLLLLTGCAAAPTTDSSPTPDKTARKESVTTSVPVTVEKTGGIAGLQDIIAIDKDGNWTKADKAGKETTGKLTADQQTSLQKLATDPKLAAEAQTVRAQSKCADAFNYSVTAGGTTVRYTDCPSDPAPPALTAQIVNTVLNAVNQK